MLSELEINKTAKEELEKQLQEERDKKMEMERNREKALREAGLSTDNNIKLEDLKLPYLMNIS